MAHGYPLKHRDLVSHHVFSTGHEALVDDLGGIVASCVDVYAFLDNAVGAGSQCLSGLVATRLHLCLRWRPGHGGQSEGWWGR